MDTILEQGQMSGKIICPNKKCGAKLGNYDWAGVCCSCKEWVVPVSDGAGLCRIKQLNSFPCRDFVFIVPRSMR